MRWRRRTRRLKGLPRVHRVQDPGPGTVVALVEAVVRAAEAVKVAAARATEAAKAMAPTTGAVVETAGAAATAAGAAATAAGAAAERVTESKTKGHRSSPLAFPAPWGPAKRC